MDIPDDRLVRSDHLSNNKQGGVCVYFISALSIWALSISTLHECINVEITIDGKLCNLLCLYRSSNKNMKTLKTFVKNLELNLEFTFNKSLYLTIVVGDFNAKITKLV